jgi:hypothetical protein
LSTTAAKHGIATRFRNPDLSTTVLSTSVLIPLSVSVLKSCNSALSSLQNVLRIQTRFRVQNLSQPSRGRVARPGSILTLASDRQNMGAPFSLSSTLKHETGRAARPGQSLRTYSADIYPDGGGTAECKKAAIRELVVE